MSAAHDHVPSELTTVCLNSQERGPTAFLDEQLVAAVNMVNMERNMEYRQVKASASLCLRVTQHSLTASGAQVVLVTGGEDMRPFRLQWPTSTVMYLIADEGAHRRGKAATKDQALRVPAGCLLRRVVARLEVG